MITRLIQANLIVLFTAITMTPAYFLQGWMAMGHTAAELPATFRLIEASAWSARGLIEALALLFLFSTEAKTNVQRAILAFFEVALIGLIGLTVGTMFFAVGQGQSLTETLSTGFFLAWNFAIAAYAPLMIGAVGVAFKIMPHDADEQLATTTPSPAAEHPPVNTPPSTPEQPVREPVTTPEQPAQKPVTTPVEYPINGNGKGGSHRNGYVNDQPEPAIHVNGSHRNGHANGNGTVAMSQPAIVTLDHPEPLSADHVANLALLADEDDAVKQTYRMWQIEQLTNQQIADRLDCHTSTVGRYKRIIKDALRRDDNDD